MHVFTYRLQAKLLESVLAMFRFLFIVIALAAGPFNPAAAGEIAITLDDLPYVPPSRTAPSEGLSQVEAVNRALAKHGIIATGFAVGSQIREDSLPALRAFAEAGHSIGNHSWSHPDYGTLTPRKFRRELRRTDAVIRELPGAAKLFRFPYLREGETERAKAAAERALEKAGYVNVPVTIDTSDWRFNAEYLDVLEAGNAAEAGAVAARYLAHMKAQTRHYRALAREGLGREVAHILLLHMNRINADHLGALLDWYAAEGWAFITVEEALRDPLYSAPDLYAGPRGISQVDRVLGGAGG